MKKLIIVLAIFGCSSNLLFSQTDTAQTNSTGIYKNEFGISLDNINMNNILNFNPKNISLFYKRKFNSFSIRAGFFTKSTFSNTILFSNTNIDSVFNEPNIEYHIFSTYRKTGASLGIEKIIYKESNVTFYCGFDLSYSNLNYFSKSTSISIDPNKKNTSANSYFITNKKPSDFYLSGNSKSFNPFLGFTNKITEHLAVTLECTLLFTDSKYSYYSSIFETDLNGRLIISYRM